MAIRNLYGVYLFFVAFATIASSSAVSAAPVVRGLQSKHPLTDRQKGDLLIGELRCVACHRREDSARFIVKAAPSLENVGSRVAPSFIRRFIADPSATHSGTTMPDVLAGESPKQRDAVALAITHFLVSQSKELAPTESIVKGNAKVGGTLFHSVGCVACHSPRDDAGKEIASKTNGTLTHLPAKYSSESLAAFLFQPLTVRPSGRMPDLNLTKAEAASIAQYLVGDGPKKRSGDQAFKVDSELANKGQQYFKQFNCVTCHELKGFDSPTMAKEFADLDAERGCISGKAGAFPHYDLSDDQRKAIQTSLSAGAEKPSGRDRINMTLTAFNCIACHVRDDFGGIPAEFDSLFQTTEPNLGNDGRIPPPLTQVGAKLNLEWMHKVLFDRESVRPYMLTRMPQFGERNLKHLPGLFEKVDHIKEVKFSEPNREQEKLYRAAGQQLLGDKGLNCITCHNFNGKPSPSFKGIDLMTTRQRLKPSWYSHFMRTPAKFRPGTIMPTYWPDGEAVHKGILDGNTVAQIEAMWYYFSLGQSARDPSGIRREGTKLVVTETTRTYRGRSRIAGYRGIAVGFPGGLNYAFNAETGTLSGLWRGEFISVGWSGQGSGGFNPAGRAVSLAQDVSFYRLANEKAAWPLLPRMTKEQPVNPDPLYPKNRGYQFKGYEFDDARIPTFFYRTGNVEVSDRSVAKSKGDKQYLVRTISFDTKKDDTVWFRVLTGKIKRVSVGSFKTDDIQVTVPKHDSYLRETTKDSAELLIKINIPEGQSAVNIEYELLR